MMTQDSIEWRPVIPFHDQSESFVHGFEMGQLYEEMKARNSIKDRLLHTVNTWQARVIANAMKYVGHFRPSETAGWCYADFEPRPELAKEGD